MYVFFTYTQSNSYSYHLVPVTRRPIICQSAKTPKEADGCNGGLSSLGGAARFVNMLRVTDSSG